MLAEPQISKEKLKNLLLTEYSLGVVQVVFLPLGADPNTITYRVVADDGKTYFLKLRTGNFDETSLTIPKFLKDQGIKQIISPIETETHRLWTNLENFKLILYPFIEGQDGFKAILSDQQWIDFGTALKRIHTLKLLADRKNHLQSETFSPKWREMVKASLYRINKGFFDEPTAVKAAAFLKMKHNEILNLVNRTERLSLVLKNRPLEFVLCHYDIHAGNILIDVNDDLYIVDWDNPILAPKERDLMFIGAGVGGVWNTNQEAKLFYKGYGQVEIDPIALAYYRYERIIEDIAVFAEGIFLTNVVGEDQERNFGFLTSNFLPNGVLEIAYKTEELLPPELKFHLT